MQSLSQFIATQKKRKGKRNKGRRGGRGKERKGRKNIRRERERKTGEGEIREERSGKYYKRG